MARCQIVSLAQVCSGGLTTVPELISKNLQPSKPPNAAYPDRKEGHCTARELASSAQVRGFSMIFLPCPTWANGCKSGYVLLEVSGEIAESCHFFAFSSNCRGTLV
jgi:hypothetical protein